MREQVGSRTFERGQEYAAQRRVRSLATRPEGSMLLGTVSGSRADTYQVIVESSPERRARGVEWWARCSGQSTEVWLSRCQKYCVRSSATSSTASICHQGQCASAARFSMNESKRAN